MEAVHTRYRGNPSFSSSLLDEIYRSIDDEGSTVCRETIRKKQSNFGGTISGNGCFEDDRDDRRACLIQKWMANKVREKTVVGRRSAADMERNSMRIERDSLYFNSSSSSCDSSCGGGFCSSEGDSVYGVLFKPKPIRTSVKQHDKLIGRRNYDQHEDSQSEAKHEGKFVKTKLKALKIYSELKKVKHPISPGGRVATFLNSLLGNTKKPKTSTTATATGGCAEAARSHLDRKSKSANASTCSSVSSFSRSCLSNTPSSRGKLSNSMRRSVIFHPVSVIVDEDCQPCGHKSLQEEETDLPSVKFAKSSIKLNSGENNRNIQEAARNLLKNYQNKVLIRSNVDMKDDEDDGKSESSSDLFELENFSAMGMHKYQEELPVYETTYIHTNRAIPNELFL